MRFITNKNSIARKIFICLLIMLTLSFAIVPNYTVWAVVEKVNKEDLPDAGGDIGGTLLKQLIQIIDAIADIIMGALNKFMLGADFSSAMLDKDDANLDNAESWLYVNDGEEVDFEFGDGTIDTSEFMPWVNTYQIPNFLYSPEAIFSNNIAALDVNFLNPNKYTAVTSDDKAKKAAISGASDEKNDNGKSYGLQKTIASWYVSFRNIAIVGLLSVLIYLGIRIVICSTAADKAKYKENLQNWVVALCLVFFIHYIMSGLLMITDQVNNLFDNTANDSIVVKVDSDNKTFNTNLIGYVRFSAQSKSLYNTFAYSLLYIGLVIYTCVFTVMYFKRFLYMAFLTMIAPLVALTYPIDKVGDGKAQAFNMWFKEYVTHLILQPVHLILYTALVSSAMDLVKNNLIYGLVAIGFLIPAEQLIKKMFNLNGAQTTSGFGSIAGGALAMKGLNNVAKALGKGKSGGNSEKSSSGSGTNGDESDSRIRMQDRDFAQSFGNDEDPNDENPNDERQRMLEDRQVWQDMANDENETEQNRLDAQREVDEIDQNLPPHQEQTDINNIDRNINTPNNNWKRKFAKNMTIKGIKKAGSVLYKKGARVLGASGGAMIGLAAGVATGDLKNAITATGAGAMAGAAIGKSFANLPEGAMRTGVNVADRINNAADNFNYERDKAQYGLGRARELADERQNKRAKTKFLNDKAEKEKYEEMAGRIQQKTNQDVSADELMNLAFDYKKAGITDDKQIENGLTMEKKYSNDNNIHENMIDIVNMTKDYGKDYVLDEKKRNSMQETIKTKVNGESNQDKVWKLYTETLGLKERGERYSMNRTNRRNPNG